MIHEGTKNPTAPYRQGWLDGRHGGPGSSTEKPRLVEWGDVSDRIAYYLGYCEGRRQANRSPRPGDARRESSARFR